MRNRNNFKTILRNIGTGIIATFAFISISQARPLNDEEKVTWLGSTWSEYPYTEGDKSLPYPPITAYIESSILYIQLDKPDGDLDIAIVSGKSGRVVWNQVCPEAATSQIAIPLDALCAGEYSLQVVNEWGGYLCGTFTK